MASQDKGAPECPEGYRRYVYRVNVQVPFRQDEPIPPSGPGAREEIQARIKKLDDQIGELQDKRKRLRKILEELP